MYRNKRIIVTICARGGSKGLAGKNIKKLVGKPLLEYTIRSARKCPLVDRIVLSTDSTKIKKIGERLGLEVPFLRSKSLATDQSGRVDAVIDAVKRAEKHWKEKYDIVVDIGNIILCDSYSAIQIQIDQVVAITPVSKNASTQ